MYLTVHRVASPSAERGINGALYSHNADRGDPMWPVANIDRMVASNIGNQVARRTDVRPGGNSVEAFLDIAFPDDLTEPELHSALQRFRNSLRSSRLELSDGPVTVSFSQNLGEGTHLLDNFDQLQRAAIQLLHHYRAAPVVQSQAPIDIIASTTERGWQFQLSPSSVERLAAVTPKEYLIPIGVPFEVADDFRKLYGELYPFVVEWVTHVSRDEVVSLGGARIIHNDKCVWKWPR